MSSAQQKLDKNKSYGRIVGETHNNARYTQNGLEFDNAGRRISRLTSEEVEAAEARKAFEDAKVIVEEKEAAAVESLHEANEQDRVEAEIKAPEKVKPSNMPDLSSGWRKIDLINHARNVFQKELDPKKPHTALVKQIERLYGC